jgi:hypothetical protein
MDRTSYDVLREKVPTTATNVAGGGYYQYEYRRYEQLDQSRAATSSSTSAYEHVLRTLRSAFLWGGYDDDSILRLIRDDRNYGSKLGRSHNAAIIEAHS